MGDFLKHWIDWLFEPTRYFIGSLVAILAVLKFRKFFSLPIVIIAAQESIRAVPSSYRDAAIAMGSTRWQVVKTIVLPQSIPGIMSE